MKWKSNDTLYPPYLRRRIRRGRGVGEGTAYVPWLKVQEVPSCGTSSKVQGIKIPRTYHLLSELETTYFYLLERRQTTIDIREQWPILDIDSTLLLSSKYGVQHKRRGSFPEPYTIDFLITECVDGKVTYRAASVKSADDAADPSVRQRLSVEFEWCRDHGTPWTLVDTSGFNDVVLANLRFMRSWYRMGHTPDLTQAYRFTESFLDSYVTNVPLSILIHRTSRQLRIASTAAEDQFRYCAWMDFLPISLNDRLSLDQPLVLRPDNEPTSL